MKYFDDIFDDLYLRQLSQKVIESNCKSNNIAGRHTWPYGHKGNHKLMGSTLFERHNLSVIHYDQANYELANQLIDPVYQIAMRMKQLPVLRLISTNIQFMGMEGTDHTDSVHPDDWSYILMLADEDTHGEDIGGHFINETQNVTVPFKHGRVVCFPCTDMHRGQAFTKPNIARLSVRWLIRDNCYIGPGILDLNKLFGIPNDDVEFDPTKQGSPSDVVDNKMIEAREKKLEEQDNG